MLEYRDSALQSWLPPKSTRMAAQGETNEKRVILGSVCTLPVMFLC
jgi:hypothetical protein